MKMFVYAFALVASAVAFLCPRVAAADDTFEDEQAARVFEAMHDDLLRCFVRARGYAWIDVEALVDSGGAVVTVKTTGGALAGPIAMRCLERRIARARFPARRGGGTSRVRTSFVYARE